MTVTSTTDRNDYTGTGATTYPYVFPITANTDLMVYVNNVLMTLTTDYAVTNAGNPAGGNVVFVNSVNGLPISILRSVPYTQGSDYVTNDAFPANTFEASLDRLTMLTQQLYERTGRSLRFAPYSLLKDKFIDDLVAAKFLRVKADLSGIEMVDMGSLGAIGLPISIAQGGTSATTAAAALAALVAGGYGTVKSATLTGASNGNNVTLLNMQGALAANTGNATDKTYYTYSLPGNVMAAGKGIRVTVAVTHSTGTAAISWRLSFGGTFTPAITAVAGITTVTSFLTYLIFNNAGVTNSQILISDGSVENSATTNASLNNAATAAIDTTAAVTINATFNVAATDQITPKLFMVELIQ